MNDCVIWSAFASSNNTVALKDVLYKGNIYQIENQMFPFPLSIVKQWGCDLSTISSQLYVANEDRFLAKWISTHDISKEAQKVLEAAMQLYKYVYRNLSSVMWLDYKIELWDMGWWQIRMAAKDMNNAKSLLNNLLISEQALSAKIREQIPALGFTPPQVVPLSD